MGKFLMYYYLIVGLLCVGSAFGSIIAGHALLIFWLIIAATVNFIFFHFVRKAEKIKERKRWRPRLVYSST
mgnify:CR=1 FL=1